MRETAHQPTGAPARTPIPAVASLKVDAERLERMWALSPAERVAAAQRGQFTLGEMLRWAVTPAATKCRSSTATSSSSPRSALDAAAAAAEED